MNKSLLAIAALSIMMASCSQDETIETTSRETITFDNTFVDNTTRVAYDGTYNTNNLGDFEVWSTISNSTGTANVFKQEVVSKTKYSNDGGIGSTWKYDKSKTQYWIPGNTYKFWAIVDGNVVNATSVTALEADKYAPTKINLLDASKQKDILLASREFINYQTGDETTVSFTFKHLLSKVKFTVKNTIEVNSGYSYKVSNITINNTAKNGEYDIATEKWQSAGNSETYDLSFGNAVAEGAEEGKDAESIGFNGSKESNYERLLIPSKKELTVSFTCELYKDNTLIDKKESKTITTSNEVELLAGHAYNFIISLGNPGEPIKFSVEKVNGWDNGNTTDTDNDGTDDSTPVN